MGATPTEMGVTPPGVNKNHPIHAPTSLGGPGGPWGALGAPGGALRGPGAKTFPWSPGAIVCPYGHKIENMVFMKSVAKRWFLHIKTNFLTKTGKLDIRHGF